MKKKKKPSEETYQITPKGLMWSETGDDKAWDSLELYCYRNQFNGVLVDKDGGKFVNIEVSK